MSKLQTLVQQKPALVFTVRDIISPSSIMSSLSTKTTTALRRDSSSTRPTSTVDAGLSSTKTKSTLSIASPSTTPTSTLQLGVAILIAVLCGYTMGVMNSVISKQSPRLATLPDVFFKFIPFVDCPALPNSFAVGMGSITILWFAFKLKNYEGLQRMLLSHSITMLIRTVCNLITLLPDPNPQCQNVIPNDDLNVFVDGFFRVATGGFHVCGDVFFSGHVALCVVCALGWTYYTNIRFAKVLTWMCVIFESWALIAVRFHYSLDIVFGIWVSWWVWSIYETRIQPAFNAFMKFII